MTVAIAANPSRNGNGKHNPNCDLDEILRTMEIFSPPGKVIEVRARTPPHAANDSRRPIRVISMNRFALLAEVERLQSVGGLYFTPDPCKPSLLARAVNKIRPAKGHPTTSDAESCAGNICKSTRTLNRPADICSSDEEHAGAIAIVTSIAEHCAGAAGRSDHGRHHRVES